MIDSKKKPYCLAIMSDLEQLDNSSVYPILIFEHRKPIIAMSKEQYFSYYTINQPTVLPKPQSQSSHIAPPNTSHYGLANTKKLLPHIIEEYQYRITNQLLAEKINHPKRDKLIAESFSHHHHHSPKKTKRHPTRQNKQNRSTEKQSRPGVRGKTCQGIEGRQQNNERQQREGRRDRSMRRENTQGGHLRRAGKTCQVEHLYRTFDDLGSSCYNYKNDYLISLQNTRMGRRLMNTRSMVQDILTKTYYTYQIYNGKIVNKDKFLKVNRNSVKFRSCNKSFGKINNGIKCFFSATVEDQQDDRPASKDSRLNTCQESSFDRVRQGPAVSDNNHGYETNNPLILQTYGHGNLNFVITHLVVDCNPPLKPDCPLLLQVIEKDQRLARVLASHYAQRNNFAAHVCTTEHAQSHAKDCHTTAPFPYQYVSGDNGFGLKFRLRCHSHIYVRLIKVEGLEQRELGVVKVDLEPFWNRSNSQGQFQVSRHGKLINGVECEREVFESKFSGHLYRFKKGEVAATVNFKYQLYEKGFKPIQQKSVESASAERSQI